MNKWKLCTILLILCQITEAQEKILKSEYSHRRYTVHDGLPELLTTSLFQDSKGFIWIGTIQGGFARFDGHQFKVFDSHGLSIVDFAEYNHHIIAIGVVSSFSVTQNDSVNQIKMVSAPGDSYCWHNSKSLPKGYAVYRINHEPAIYSVTDTGLVKVWHHELLSQMNEANNIYWDKSNRHFIFSTEDSGMYVVHENGTVENHFDVNAVNSFVPYGNTIWAVGHHGLYEYTDGELKHILEYPFFTGESADIQLLEDSEHNLLIRTISALYRYSKGKLEMIADNFISSYDMSVDNEGNIWVAAANGLFNFYKLNFKNYTLLPEGSVSQSIVIDNRNRVWLPTLDGRIMRMENEKTEIVKHSPSPFGYSFFERGSIARDHFLYMPGGATILKYDGNKNVFQWLSDFSPNLIQYLSILPNGDLVAGNTTSVIVYSFPEGIKRIYKADELKQHIFNSFVDKQGNLLLGGVEGITIINDNTIRLLHNDTLKMCTNMRYDKDGKLWLICRNRLVSMENDRARIEHTFQKNLCNLHITRNGIMIVTTDDELYVSPDTKQLNFIRHDQNNGYNNAFGIKATHIAEDMDGNIFIPTIVKIVRFHPDNLLGKTQPPKPYTDDIQMSVNNIHWKKSNNQQPILDYRYKNIRISYLGLSYSAAQNVRYHYRLLGFQNEWSEPTKQREITFNNLPPGDYIFEIYADTGTEESRSQVQSYPFSITPAFWQTTWFIIACIALLILGSAGIALYVQRRKNRALMEKLRAEKELNELRISSIRLKAIPHFNANVLSAIEYYIANRTKEEAMRLLGIYSDFTFKTLSEVDKAARPLSEELAYVKMYLDLEKIRFLDKFDFQIKVEEGVDKTVQLPNMILHTYCENAVKHGLMPLKSGGMLMIKVSQRHHTVCVSVVDNGVGRSYAAQNPHLHSSKQGLSILNRQIEIYNRFNRDKINQQIDDLYSEAGRPSGTRFRVEVPLDFAYMS